MLLCIDCGINPRKVARKDRIRKRCQSCIDKYLKNEPLINEKTLRFLYIEKGLNACKIGKLYSTTGKTVGRYLEKYAITKKSASEARREYEINEKAFDNLDNEDAMYFFGFLLADGYNNKKKKSIYWVTTEQDKHILEKFSLFIGSNKPLRYELNKLNNTYYYKVAVENMHMVSKLDELGITQAKTFTRKLSKQLLKNEYLYALVRGYFDGNGSFSKPTASFWGNRDLLKQITNILIKDANMNNLSVRKRPDKNSCYFCIYNISNLKRLYDYMYKERSTCLDRKRIKILDYITNHRPRKQ